MAKFYNIWIVALAAVWLSAHSAQAYLCMCSPNSCVLIHPNTDFFENAESFCSTFRTAAHDISIIKLMDRTLSSNAFQKFPNMTALEIFQGQLESISSDTFNGAEKLLKLLIRGNHLSSLGDYSFKGADNLRDLMISSNPLSKISENAFANLKNLEILILAHGELTALPKNLFQNNRMLKMISLSSNKITSIDEEVFTGLDDLAKLELGDNQLTAFDFKFLKAGVVVVNNNSLQHLVINDHCSSMYASNNQIETISVGNGANVNKLVLLHNRIRDISNITKLVNLTSLTLGSNELEPNSVFNTLPALEELMLQSTNINLTSETFANLSNLKILDLSYNNLTEADFKIFSKPNVIQILSYVGNRIKSFNYLEAREFLPRLRVLEICKNGWNNTYFETNILRMKRFQISPDIHGFASHFLFRDEYVNMCSERLVDDYAYEDYAEPPPDNYVEDEIKESYPKELTTTRTTSTAATTTTTPTTPAPTSTQRSTSTERANSVTHHIAEHNTNTTAGLIASKDTSTVEKASPFFVTFQVVVYILSVVGLVALGAVAYLWKKRQLSGVRTLTSDPGSTDAVRLI